MYHGDVKAAVCCLALIPQLSWLSYSNCIITWHWSVHSGLLPYGLQRAYFLQQASSIYMLKYNSIEFSSLSCYVMELRYLSLSTDSPALWSHIAERCTTMGSYCAVWTVWPRVYNYLYISIRLTSFLLRKRRESCIVQLHCFQIILDIEWFNYRDQHSTVERRQDTRMMRAILQLYPRDISARHIWTVVSQDVNCYSFC